MESGLPSLDEIQNFVQLSEGLGTAGQPFRNQFPLIAAAGFEAVINLARPDSLDAVPDEAELVQALGLEYIPIPVVWEAPLLADLDLFFDQMDRLQGRRVFVHCARNMRVSAFLYLYRILRQGMPHERAWRDLQRIWTPNDTWLAFIHKALAAYQSSNG